MQTDLDSHLPQNETLTRLEEESTRFEECRLPFPVRGRMSGDVQSVESEPEIISKKKLTYTRPILYIAILLFLKGFFNIQQIMQRSSSFEVCDPYITSQTWNFTSQAWNFSSGQTAASQ